jgi:multidrug efflux system membrane fusion protein
MTHHNPSRRTSILIAAGIALALGVWMGSGLLQEAARPPAASPARNSSAGTSERPMQVMIRQSVASRQTRRITASARTEPNRTVEIRAEIDGTIVDLGAERGTRVAEGRLIAAIDMRDRQSQLEETEALIVQMRLQYEAAERLKGQQFVSDAQIAEARARLVGAQAARDRIQLEIDRTQVLAPFDALIQEREVEIGDYVKSGDSIARLVDTDPMIVVAEVNEREVAPLRIGSQGTAVLIDGTEHVGTVRYLSPVAADSTRTFRIELAIPNADNRIRAGMTAELQLDAEEITAHALSAALLALADDGTIGVKTVDEFSRVRFYPIELVGSTEDGALVTGLPNSVRVISVGQGFVTDGQVVVPVEDPAAMSSAKDERAY